ncbi:hypothetical protein J6590_073042 [Homalodisca vitripennis]|nr:hypothetical protein J6590_073042 [Homalodisca vitripennis]
MKRPARTSSTPFFIRQVKSAFLIKPPEAITPCRRLLPPLNYGLIILLANFYTAQFMGACAILIYKRRVVTRLVVNSSWLVYLCLSNFFVPIACKVLKNAANMYHVYNKKFSTHDYKVWNRQLQQGNVSASNDYDSLSLNQKVRLGCVSHNYTKICRRIERLRKVAASDKEVCQPFTQKYVVTTVVFIEAYRYTRRLLKGMSLRRSGTERYVPSSDKWACRCIRRLEEVMSIHQTTTDRPVGAPDDYREEVMSIHQTIIDRPVGAPDDYREVCRYISLLQEVMSIHQTIIDRPVGALNVYRKVCSCKRRPQQAVSLEDTGRDRTRTKFTGLSADAPARIKIPVEDLCRHSSAIIKTEMGATVRRVSSPSPRLPRDCPSLCHESIASLLLANAIIIYHCSCRVFILFVLEASVIGGCRHCLSLGTCCLSSWIIPFGACCRVEYSL